MIRRPVGSVVIYFLQDTSRSYSGLRRRLATRSTDVSRSAACQLVFIQAVVLLRTRGHELEICTSTLISSILYPVEWLKGAKKGLLDVALIGKVNIRGGSK